MDRLNQVLDKAFSNPKTKDNYKSRLRGLTKSLNEADPLVILKAPDTYYPKLQELYPSFSTRKNMLTLVLVLFREDPPLKARRLQPPQNGSNIMTILFESRKRRYADRSPRRNK